MIVLDLSILNQKGTPMFNSDTFANRPTFGIVGRIFISTDTKEFFRDTGTSWELIGGPGSGTITGSGAAGQVTYFTGASSVAGSNNLFWDAANNHLGINTNTPGTALDIHHNQNTILQLNQTTATNDTRIAFQNSGTALWRIGNFYTAGANDFSVFDVIGNLQQFTIVNTTGQTFVGAKTTAAGRLVINSATSDAHLQVVGANAPSIRIDNAGSGGTQRFVFGLATATNNFIQGATAGEFCISTQSAGNMLFGMWQTINASEVMRITTSNNLVIGSTFDGGQKLQVTGTAYISGNVGIGTISPTSKLEVFGSSQASPNTANGILKLNTSTTNAIIFGTLSGSPFSTYIQSGGSNTYPLLLNPNGANVIIANTLDTGQKFQVTGTTRLNGESVIVSPSGITIRNGASDGFSFQQSAANSWSWTALTSGSNYNIQLASVGIGTATPDASSLLDVTSVGKGFLPPRMTTAQKNAITTPAAGLIVYDTTLNKLCVRTAATWETITSV